jgi:hypothetical protein
MGKAECEIPVQEHERDTNVGSVGIAVKIRSVVEVSIPSIHNANEIESMIVVGIVEQRHLGARAELSRLRSAPDRRKIGFDCTKVRRRP